MTVVPEQLVQLKNEAELFIYQNVQSTLICYISPNMISLDKWVFSSQLD
jgi:hypothetical protein